MADRVGQQLGNYRLVRLIGRGGFAEVYLGEHRRLGTQAAVKILHTRLVESEEVERFQQEARTIAHLEHPHIVRVLDFDVQEGIPFLILSYAPHGNLRQRQPRGIPLSLKTIVDYVKQVAAALQYAHEQRVIHRDVKPENMLIGRHQEILLSDFGIALLAQSSRLQSTQEVAGTAHYMAPEQLQGKPRLASDQYALGIVVYEWLCGRPPFKGSFTEIASQHVLTPPPALHEQVPTIVPQVEQVVLRALEKDAHHRFASVQAFASALEQASQGEKEPPFAHVVGGPSSLINSPPVSVILSENVPTEFLHPPTVAITPPAMNVPPMGTLLYTYRGHSGAVSSVVWSPDGTRIASASDDGTVQVWAATTGNAVLTYHGHSKAVSTVAWSPDGTRIASAGADQTVQIWEATTGHHLVTYSSHTSRVWAIAWSPEGDCIASASDDQTIQVWSAPTGELVFTCHGHSHSVWTVAWSPDDEYLAFESDMKMIQVCDCVEGHKVRTYRGHTDLVWAIAWSPDGTTIASGGEDRTVQIWTVANGRKILTYQGHSAPVIAIAWSPDGAYIASAGDDQTVQVWMAATGKKIFTYRGHSDNIIAVAWSPDGTRIASAGEDRTIQVWFAT